MEKLAGDLPESNSYIFDSSDQKFIYPSKSNPALQNTILSLERKHGLERLIQESSGQMVIFDCIETGRIFLIKQMAANLFFVLCVENNKEIVEKASKVMASAFQD